MLEALAAALAPALRGEVPSASYVVPFDLVAAVTWSGAPVGDAEVRDRAPALVPTPMLSDVLPNVPGHGPAVSLPTLVPPAAGAGAAAHAPGVAKRNAVLSFTGVTSPMGSVATFIEVTDELAEDSAIVPWLDVYLPWLVKYAEQNELLNGTGVSPHLLGFLSRTDIKTTASAATGPGLIAAMRGEAAASGFLPDIVVIHPTDYSTIIADDAGLGLLVLLGAATIIEAPQLAPGAALVGSRMTAPIVRGADVLVEATNSHDVNFAKNIRTIRAASRLALGVIAPTAWVKKGAAAPITASEPSPAATSPVVTPEPSPGAAPAARKGHAR